MGYQTYFSGQFELDEPLTPAQAAYLKAFALMRRMTRNAGIAETLPDPKRQAVGLPIGRDAEYFVGNEENFGQNDDKAVVDHNRPPGTQPGLWCQWVPTEDGSGIVWDEGEKFYEYVEWLEYLIEHFLMPWGRKLNGQVQWSGAEPDDRGVIYVKDNEVRAVEDTITNRAPW